MLNWPKKNGPALEVSRAKEEEREVSLGGETDCTESKRRKGLACVRGPELLHVEQRTERSVRVDHERPQRPG